MSQVAVRPRKERNAAETKRRILEAAAAEFASKGFDGARLGSIARAAGVQQPLIHHYFVDKESLLSEVLRDGVATMVADAWRLVGQMDLPAPERSGKKRRGAAELRVIAEASVDLLLRFFGTNGALLAILRQEARAGERNQAATRIVAEHVAPLFEATAVALDEMRARGEIRKDVDSRQLVLSCIAMVAFPFEEEAFVSLVWPSASPRAERLAERKRHVVEMILASVVP